MKDIVMVDDEQRLKDFVEGLSKAPTRTKNSTDKPKPKKSGYDYVTIKEVEDLLDVTYAGLWKTDNFRWSVVANEAVGSIDLHVFHPIAQVWITRTGAGAAMIQQQSGTVNITDINSKIKNTLGKDFPHLKAECVKNAAKSLGKAFGRDLNRNDEEPNTAARTTTTSSSSSTVTEIKKCRSIEELTVLFKKTPNNQRDEKVMAEFKAAKEKILAKK